MIASQHLFRHGHDHVGGDIAGADGVDGDAGPGALLGQRLGEADVAGLGGGIVDLADLALLAVDRGDGDDAAELAVAHAAPHRMGHVEDADRLVSMTSFHCSARHLVEHGVAGDAGIVDQHVDRAEIGLDLADAGGAGIVVGDRPFVDRDAGLRLEFLRRLVIAGIVRGDAIAGLLQRDRDRRADAARAACDDCNLAMRFPLFDTPVLSGFLCTEERAGGSRRPVINIVQSASTHMATPMPPPMHSVARPFLAPRRRISKTSVLKTRAPDAPIGWPMAMAPPLTLTIDGIPAHVLVDGAGLRGEGLVGLDQIEVADRPAGLLQRLARGRDRSGAHDRRVDAGGGPGNDARQRRDAALGGFRLGHQHHGGGAVIDAGGVAGGHRAFLVEGRPQLGHGVERRAVADIFVLVDDRVALACP